MNDTLLIPVTTVQPDLVTQTDVVVYVPLASKTAHGIVKIGDGLNITAGGLLSFDRSEVTIKYIAKNGVDIQPDANKRVNITLNKSDVGLNNVDNTSDINKPISKAQQEEFDRINGLIKGADKAVAFASYAEMVSALNNKSKDEYSIGQTIFIGTQDVPDVWIYAVENISEKYNYTTDEEIETKFLDDQTIKVGYYRLSALESKEIDVRNFMTLDTKQTVTGDKNFTGDLRKDGMAVATIDDFVSFDNDFIINNYVSFVKKQNLTDAQKAIARANIGAGTGEGGGSSEILDSGFLTYYTTLYEKTKPNLLRIVQEELIVYNSAYIGESPQRKSDGGWLGNRLRLVNNGEFNPGVRIEQTGEGQTLFDRIEGKVANYSAVFVGLKPLTKYTLSFNPGYTFVENPVIFGKTLHIIDEPQEYIIEFTTNDKGSYTIENGVVLPNQKGAGITVSFLSLVEGDYVGYVFPGGDVTNTYDVQYVAAKLKRDIDRKKLDKTYSTTSGETTELKYTEDGFNVSTTSGHKFLYNGNEVATKYDIKDISGVEIVWWRD